MARAATAKVPVRDELDDQPAYPIGPGPPADFGQDHLRRVASGRRAGRKTSGRDIQRFSHPRSRSAPSARRQRTRRMASASDAIVAKITPSKMVEMFEMMAELEGFLRPARGAPHDAGRARGTDRDSQEVRAVCEVRQQGRLSRDEQDISSRDLHGVRTIAI